MYYDNKLGFYIKQYSIQIIVGIVCLFVISSGLFLYYKINDNTSNEIVNMTAENNVNIYEETVIAEDDSILPEEMRKLAINEKLTVKVVSVETDGSIIVLIGTNRMKAKLIGLDFSKMEPDTVYLIGQDLQGSFVDIAFDSSKVSNGYAIVYVYTDSNTLYNAKLLENGKLIMDSRISRKCVHYNDLAESQAYAKQVLSGVWGQ